MAKSRELKIVVTGDARQLDRTFAKAGKDVDGLGKKADGMGKKFSTGMKVAGAAAAGALVVGLKQATAAAIEAEKSQARMETQLKASGQSYRAHAKEIENVIQKTSKLAGLDDEQLQDAFTNIVRVTGDVDKSLRLVGLAADFARGKQIDVAKAGEIVAKVAGGNTGILSRYGIQVKEGASATEALGMLQEKFKGQAEAYGKTTAGATDRAAVGWENLNEVVGAKLAPTLAKVADKLANLSNWAAANPGKFKAIAIAIASVTAAIGTLIVAAKIATAVKVLRTAMIGLNLAFLTNPAVLIVAGLVALGAALVVAYKKSETFRRIVDGAFSAVKTAARVAIQAVISILDKLMGVWSTMLGALGKVPGFGWAKRAANAIDAAREKMRAFGKSIDDIPNEKKIRITASTIVIDGQRLTVPSGPANRNAGGIIPGQGNTDTVPAMLTPGEYVIRKSVVEKFGPMFFSAINAGQKPQLRTSGGIIAKANAIDAKAYPYVWGGGHSRTGVPDGGTGRDPGIGYDCSGAVSAILGVSPPRVSGAFTSWGKPGPGSPNDTKVYANNEHIFAVLNGRGWGTSGENPGGGAGWLSYNHRSGFTIRHINDGGAKGSSSRSSRSGGSRSQPNLTGAALTADAAYEAGFRGAVLVKMVAIAARESNHNPNATNLKPPDHSIGLWQINQLAHKGRFGTDAELKDPYTNARAAYALYQEAGLAPWVATRGVSKGQLATAGRVVSSNATARSSSGGSLRGSSSGDDSSSGSSGSSASDRATSAGARIANAIAAPFMRDTPGGRRGTGFGGRGGSAPSLGIRSLLKGAGGLGELIDNDATSFGQAERRFGQTEEDLGTAEGRKDRLSEIKALRELKEKTLARQQARAEALKQAISKYKTMLSKLGVARKKAKGGVRAKINERIRTYEERLDELKAELVSLGFAIEDTQLDIGDLDKDAADVAGTPDSESSSVQDQLGARLSDIDLQERAGMLSPEQAKAARITHLTAALNGGGLDERQRWEVMAQLRDAQEASTQATNDLAVALAEVKASIDAQLAFADRVSSITSMEAVRAMADMMSGDMGARTQARSQLPGSGRMSRL